MKNKPESQEVQKYTPEEVKKLVLSYSVAGDVYPDLNKLASLLPKWINGTPKEQKEAEKEVKELASKVMYAFEADSHVALMEGFNERFRGGARELCKQFIRDFDCKTDSEKIMAETAAVAFMRYLDASRRLNNCLDVNNMLSPTKTAYMGMLSKERDRAHRQYLSTVSTIKQLKAPTVEMNIKTNTAFVAQNQLINAPSPKNPPISTKNENNEVK